MTETNATRKNYNAIDLAKLICSVMVVMIHVAPFGHPPEENSVLIDTFNDYIRNCLTRIAVPFFFVCSGFFLYRKTTEQFDFSPTKKYAIHLGKLYLIWSAVYLPFIIQSIIHSDKGIFYELFKYARNFVFVGSYYHLWYLPATIFAVILISFLLLRKISVRKILIFSGILYFVGLLAQSWFILIKPLQQAFPTVWKLLKLVEDIISTTRNGLFDAFVFVAIGVAFAYHDGRLSKIKSLTGFIVSMILLVIEMYVLKSLHSIRENDMYLCLIPAVFFAFSWLIQVELPPHPIYQQLRKMSTLIYFIHAGIKSVLFDYVKDTLIERSCLFFLIVVALTLLFSVIIIQFSQFPKLKWLKIFYN